MQNDYAPNSTGHAITIGSEGNDWTFDIDENGSVVNLRQADDDAAAAATTEQPSTLRAVIEAVASHDAANELAKLLSVDGFEAKKPKVAEKKAALLAKAEEDPDLDLDAPLPESD